jgi:APA family basic amino acid/polyamine antiporter
LGPLDGAAVVISNVIGVGIFTAPGIVALLVPHPLTFLAVWLAGGLLAFVGAGAYAELAALRPRAGGEYVYLREAFGPLAGFLTGWTSFVAGFSGAIAAGAVGLCAYLGRYMPTMADPKPILAVPLYLTRIEISPMRIGALVFIFALAAIHLRGLSLGRLTQNLITSTEMFALATLVVLGFAFGHGSAEHLVSPAGPVSGRSWLLALVPVMFTYSGWNATAYLAEEVREPVRNLPRALALGTTAVIGFYLMLNTLYVYALSPAKLAGVIRVGDAAAEALFGARGAALLTPLLAVALTGSLSAMTLAGPRVYFAMARDGLFFRAAAHIHPRYHTPANAILAQAAWSGLLVLTGTFEQLLLYTGFAVLLFSGLAVSALFVLRARATPTDIPFRAWGYPVLPAVFVLSSLAIVLNAIREQPVPTLAGLGIIAAGAPLYWWSAWKRV